MTLTGPALSRVGRLRRTNPGDPDRSGQSTRSSVRRFARGAFFVDALPHAAMFIRAFESLDEASSDARGFFLSRMLQRFRLMRGFICRVGVNALSPKRRIASRLSSPESIQVEGPDDREQRSASRTHAHTGARLICRTACRAAARRLFLCPREAQCHVAILQSACTAMSRAFRFARTHAPTAEDSPF